MKIKLIGKTQFLKVIGGITKTFYIPNSKIGDTFLCQKVEFIKTDNGIKFKRIGKPVVKVTTKKCMVFFNSTDKIKVFIGDDFMVNEVEVIEEDEIEIIK